MGKISIKGILIGAITDIVSTNITIIPLTIFIMHSLRLTGMQHEKVAAAVLSTLRDNPFYYSLSLLLGGLCSILGGYVSAKIAKHDEILNGALASFLCVGSGVYTIVHGSSSMPLWQSIIFLLLSILFAAFGGFLRLQHSKW